MIDLNEAIQKIKVAGPNKVRIIPVPGTSITGSTFQIEANNHGTWEILVTNIPKAMAESLVSQASNKGLLG